MIVELRGVSLSYQSPEGEIEALRDVSFSLSEGELVSLVGPSGCGKSSLLSIIAGLETPSSGELRVPTGRIGLMPQRDGLFEWRSIWGNVTLPLTLQKSSREQRRHDEARLRELLERYGLAEFAARFPSQLSGGMRQRCALIRTLAPNPALLLLDEPFSALDYQTRLAVADDVYAILRREKKTALIVTHDISEAVSMTDRVIVLTRRPATVKSIHTLSGFGDCTPLQRRDSPLFREYFQTIWKELDVHV